MKILEEWLAGLVWLGLSVTSFEIWHSDMIEAFFLQ